MRDLLFLAHRIPYPPDKGDKIRSFHILRYLSSRFRIHLGCFSDNEADAKDVEELRKMCADVYCLPLSRTNKIARGLGALLKGTSISEANYRDRRMEQWVKQKISACSVEDILIFCSAMYPYVEKYAANLHTVIDMVDVDSQKWADFSQSARWPMRMIYLREQRRLFDLEQRAAHNCDWSLFVSRAEAELFAKLAPDTARKIHYMNNGVDLQRFSPAVAFPSPFPSESLPIVFTGMMNYRPNVDAVVWFAREAMPLIRQAHEAAEFWIVGKNPVASVRNLSRMRGINVVGEVPDVRPYIANARCIVAPLRIARGVQNKVLEGMAMAKPVVLTPAALEGLSAAPGVDVLVGTTAAELARLTVEVLMGAAIQRLGPAARSRIESDYRWDVNLQVLENIFAGSPRQVMYRGIKVA